LKIGDKVKVKIESLTYGGEGLGRINNKVVFIPLSAPGDVVRAELTEIKKNYLRAKLVQVNKRSKHREVPPCKHFGICGGCHWQYLSYTSQCEAKKKILKDSLVKIGKFRDPTCLPIISSPTPYEYRHRVRFQVGQVDSLRLGFFREGSKEVVEIRECPLLYPLINKMIEPLANVIEVFFGYLPIRNVDVSVFPDKDQAIIAIHIHHEKEENYSDFIRTLKTEIPHIFGITIYRHLENEIKEMHFGKCFIEIPLPIAGKEHIGPVYFRVSEGVFSQANARQNANLILKVAEFLDLTGEEVLLDLYCGMGNLCIPLSPGVRKIIGIEAHNRSVQDAAFNAEIVRGSECQFFAMNVLEGLDYLLEHSTSMDYVILDPPREGGKEVIDRMLQLKPRKILYVSCNPATLARDCSSICGQGYRLGRTLPFDMFPQTYHIESITELVQD